MSGVADSLDAPRAMATTNGARCDRPPVRLLHTSDLHISTSQRSMDAFQAALEIAIDLDVDVVLIAGDLFDHPRLSEDVTNWTIDQLRRLHRPTVIIAGNHDCLDDLSIYHRIDLTEAGDHVHFVGDPKGRHLRFEGLRLAIWARGIEIHDPENRPLLGYEPDDPSCWRVVVTHGHYVPRGETSDRSSQIDAAELASLECDYVALGHWHRFLDVSADGVSAFYSGSPADPGIDFASVNLVELDPHRGVTVQRVPLHVPVDPGLIP